MNRRTGRPESGLVRRVMDRAVTLYASENGNMQGLQQVAEVIAPEVTSIEFQYFDGTAMVVRVGFGAAAGPAGGREDHPVAEPRGGRPRPDPSVMNRTFASTQVQSEQMYSLTVRLPTAKPVTSDGDDGQQRHGSGGTVERRHVSGYGRHRARCA